MGVSTGVLRRFPPREPLGEASRESTPGDFLPLPGVEGLGDPVPVPGRPVSGVDGFPPVGVLSRTMVSLIDPRLLGLEPRMDLLRLGDLELPPPPLRLPALRDRLPPALLPRLGLLPRGFNPLSVRPSGLSITAQGSPS